MLKINAHPEQITSLNLDLVLGDKSGYIHVQSDQTFYIEFDEYHLTRSSPPCSFIIDYGGDLWVSADFRIIGDDRTAMLLEGHLVGMYNLTLEKGRQIIIGENATNARLVGTSYVTLTDGMLNKDKVIDT